MFFWFTAIYIELGICQSELEESGYLIIRKWISYDLYGPITNHGPILELFLLGLVLFFILFFENKNCWTSCVKYFTLWTDLLFVQNIMHRYFTFSRYLLEHFIAFSSYIAFIFVSFLSRVLFLFDSALWTVNVHYML